MTKRIARNAECTLPFAERDRLLLEGKWPNRAGLGSEWKFSQQRLTRWLEFVDAGEEEAENPDVEAKIRESILRFPNAPIYSLHDAPTHPVKLDEQWPNYHTLRVLSNGNLPPTGARHIFLLHNGLNETDDMALHYWIASWILAKRDDAVCIIRPLPGHLSRHPFQGPFSERPLDEYLRNPADVFRQFLRYMVETQWLLSALVPRQSYNVMTGCELLRYNSTPGREHAPALAQEITEQANQALDASTELAKKGGGTSYSKDRLDVDPVCESVEAIRDLVGWSPLPPDERPDPDEIDQPAIHVVGYSMGGFFAQSVFCAWPFAVASCSNLFAGGALRDLAPTAFAHPEEWQSVLHGLRSELDHARVEGYFGTLDPEGNGNGKALDGSVLGIKGRTFEYLNRIFTDVFLQADRGSYSTRLEEFGRRMLFILGGEDPIVRTRNVLDAAPPGGINLHQIGDVSHFPSRKSEPAGEVQRDFWLPELGGMIARFAERSAGLLQQIHGENWLVNGRRKSNGRAEQGERPLDRALPNAAFEQELDLMLEMLKEEMLRESVDDEEGMGWLFIARNQVPTVFRGAKAFRDHAAAMHHSEDLIGSYVDSLVSRARLLKKIEQRLTLLIPSSQMPADGASEKDHALQQRKSDRARFSKSEVGVRYWPDERAIPKTWAQFRKKWCTQKAVRTVTGNEYVPGDLGRIGEAWASVRDSGQVRVESGSQAHKISLTMLPDVWIAFDKRACNLLLKVDEDDTRDVVERQMVDLACRLAERKKKTTKILGECLTTGAVRIVKVSAAELNPRYRGRLLDGSRRDTRGAANLLVHWAIAREASDLVHAA